MRLRSLLTSTLFHIIVLVLLTVGITFAPDDDVEMPPAMTVELAKVADISQTPTPAPKPKPKPKKEEPKPAKKPVDTPKPAPTNTSDVPVKPVEKPAPPEDKPKPPQLKPKQIKKPEAVPPPEPKKEEESNKKSEPPPPQRDFGSVLKNLADVEEEAAEIDENAQDDPVAEEGHNAPLGETLTISEVDALRRQLEGCWNVPIGARDVENMVIDVNLIVNPDRTVKQASIVDTSRYNSDSLFRAVADTAIRAVRSPACSPLELPEGKYDMWKNIIVEFNPREMF